MHPSGKHYERRRSYPQALKRDFYMDTKNRTASETYISGFSGENPTPLWKVYTSIRVAEKDILSPPLIGDVSSMSVRSSPDGDEKSITSTPNNKPERTKHY